MPHRRDKQYGNQRVLHHSLNKDLDVLHQRARLNACLSIGHTHRVNHNFLMKTFRMLAICSFLLVVFSSRAQIVINEVFYHAPDDLTDLQWVELYNNSDQPVSLSGWVLAKALKFTFAATNSIAARGYVVLCKDRKTFQEFYDVPVTGEFERSFKHTGERLELRNPAGQVVDSLEFSNRPPWPRGPDGRTASLERICPSALGKLPENWAGSPLSEDATHPGGTPGVQNTSFSATLPPWISQVRFPSNTIPPQQAMPIEAQVQSPTELKRVTLLYRVIQAGSEGEEVAVPMSKTAKPGYSATIPGQQAGQVVRFRIQAVDANSAERFYPSPTEPHPAVSLLVFTNSAPGKVPQGYFIHSDPEEAKSALHQLQGGGQPAPTTPEGQTKFMAQMEFRNALDLPQLWTALTLSNCTAPDLEKLRQVFMQKQRDLDQLERKVMQVTNPGEARTKASEGAQSFKTGLGKDLDPIMSEDQKKEFEKWRDAASGRGGMGEPIVVLRQFIRLEPGYLHLALSPNIASNQLVAIREVYRDAIQERNGLVPELRQLMSNQAQDRNEAGQKFQEKAMAMPAEVAKKLKKTLTASQASQFSGWETSDQPSFMRHARTKTSEPVMGESAFILVDAQTGRPTLFDFVRIPERSGGWKVHFGKDQSWNGMSVVDIIFESSDRWLLAEPLAYDLHRRAGLKACQTDFLRLTVDGQPAGYYLVIEQVNKAFFRNNGIRDDGNLYKANWVGNGLVGKHDKHINRHTGHDDLVQLVQKLENSKSNPDEQWTLIRREFDVEEVINHYAVRMLISDWDGFFNNYWLYHDVNGTGKWRFYPWDEDKTWGEYDGWEPESGGLYNMPLGFGAEGDHPPGERGDRPSTSYGFGQWWRAGGYVSRPLLANPTFRKHFLSRVRQLLETEFTEARLFPLVDAIHERLGGEITYRAQVVNESPEVAQRRFESNLESLKEFIRKRRAWLLEQAEIRSAGSFDRTQL
jgi:hypothetical protein